MAYKYRIGKPVRFLNAPTWQDYDNIIGKKTGKWVKKKEGERCRCR